MRVRVCQIDKQKPRARAKLSIYILSAGRVFLGRNKSPPNRPRFATKLRTVNVLRAPYQLGLIDSNKKFSARIWFDNTTTVICIQVKLNVFYQHRRQCVLSLLKFVCTTRDGRSQVPIDEMYRNGRAVSYHQIV